MYQLFDHSAGGCSVRENIAAGFGAGKASSLSFCLTAEIRLTFAGINFDAIVVGTAGHKIQPAVGFLRYIAFDIARRVSWLAIYLAQTRYMLCHITNGPHA
jgi:hypothetical protein